MLAKVYTCAVIGLDAQIVEVEVDTGRGLPAFFLVGLPDAAVKESSERIRSAIKNSDLHMHGGRITVNLAPADLRKAGPSYDLPIAIGILAATDQIPVDDLDKALFVGELGLDGAVRHVRGVLPERNSIGAPNIELIRERVHVLYGMDGGLGFNTLPTTKPPLIEGLAVALSHHGFKVPKAAADELRAYQVELSTVGHPKFGAPEGLHDDWVIALALTWHAMTAGGVEMVTDPFANW